MACLRHFNQKNPYYWISRSDKESLKDGKKEVVFEINDGSDTKPIMTEDRLYAMTVGQMRMLAGSDEIELTTILRDRRADDESDSELLF